MQTHKPSKQQQESAVREHDKQELNTHFHNVHGIPFVSAYGSFGTTFTGYGCGDIGDSIGERSDRYEKANNLPTDEKEMKSATNDREEEKSSINP